MGVAFLFGVAYQLGGGTSVVGAFDIGPCLVHVQTRVAAWGRCQIIYTLSG